MARDEIAAGATRVVASILTSSTREMVGAMRDGVGGADLVELRVDGLRDPDLETLLAERRALDIPAILTCRSPREGGVFAGSERERLDLLRRAQLLGFDYVDIELDALAARVEGRSRIIVSKHLLEEFPADPDELVRRALAAGADLVKLAARVSSLSDALRLARAGAPARDAGRGFVPVALGPSGISGRVLAARWGAELVYAAARGLPPTGPGQLGLDELLEVFRFRAIGPTTQIYGIVGHAVSESLSPAMHNAHFRRLGLDAVYLPFSEPDLDRFVAAARDLGIAGLSVTRPHKQAILASLDELDPLARRVRAVNTVVVREGKWTGYNTDVDGVVAPLARRIDLRGRRAVVLGAGGAARAAVIGLAGEGARVTVLARRAEAARDLAGLVGGQAGGLEETSRLDWDVLVQATPVGSKGVPGVPGGIDRFPEGAVVLDMIYEPEETPLLARARRAGAGVVPGLEMLVAQAVRQAELWTGTAPVPADLERTAREEMARRASRPAALPERYSRQVMFRDIGEDGQRKILRSRVLVVGVGALGSVSADLLARSGVGFLRLVDRDYVDRSNLQRQVLFDEEDVAAGLPKAVAAAGKLRTINAEIEVSGLVEDLNEDNAEELLRDVDLVIDGTDNFETRYLVNDACIQLGKPWIYGACVGSYGMSFVIRPGTTPCLRCLLEEEPAPGASPTCDTAGVIGPIVHAVAAFQTAEALKILAGREDQLTGSVVTLDVWSGRFDRFRPAARRADCPACGKRQLDYLSGRSGSRTTTLCGRNAIQIRPAVRSSVSLDELAARLRPLGQVRVNPYLLRFREGGRELVLFPDGRAIVHGTEDPSEARGFYAKYVGA